MPFVSQAQRRWMYANDPAMAARWQDHTPKDKKLPEKVKHAYVVGGADALEALGLKSASEELRLKIPARTFHGFDAAKKSEAVRGQKSAVEQGKPVPQDSEDIEHMLGQIDAPISPNTQLSTRDHLDRTTSWGAPSNLSAGDTAGRLSDMGQNTGFGGI